jgi:hypothetical protein
MALGSGHNRPGAWISPTRANPVARPKAAGTVAIPAVVFNLFRIFRAGRFGFNDLLPRVGEGVAV